LSTAMKENKIPSGKVPPNLQPLYDGTRLSSVWQTGEGLLFLGELGAVQYADWNHWGQDYWTARQTIRSEKLTEYPKDGDAFSIFAFHAAMIEIDGLRKAAALMRDKLSAPPPQIVRDKDHAETIKPFSGFPLSLRPYQERAVKQLTEVIRAGKKRILLVGPTGMGKMVLAAYLMKQTSAKGNPCLFLADFRELIGQCADKLKQYGVPCGVIMSNSGSDQNNSLAQVASKDTLWARAFRTDKMEPPKARLVIGDEAHKSRSETWGKVLGHYKDAIVLGMTATPCRQDGRGLGAFYDAMIIVATYKELRDDGWIVPAKVYAPTVPNLKGVKVSGGDYVKDELSKRMDTHTLVGDIVKDWRKRADGRQTVVFASGVMHSLHIRTQFQKFGVKCEHVDAKNVSWNERVDILGRLHDGLTTVVTNFGILTTGWDEPSVSCMVCARPTRSYGLWRQMAGRVLRSHPGKTDSIILDHSGAVFRHGYPDEDVEWELGEDKNINEKIKEKFEKEAKEQRDPYACPKCAAVYRGPICPECSYKPEPKERAVRMKAGELQEVTREQLRKEHTLDDKQKKWNEMLGWAVGTNAKLGAAAARYKQTYGTMPPSSLQRVPRGRQWQMPAKEYWQAIMDYEKLGLEMPENET